MLLFLSVFNLHYGYVNPGTAAGNGPMAKFEIICQTNDATMPILDNNINT